MAIEKQLENRDPKIYENEIKESKDFRQLNRWKEELKITEYTKLNLKEPFLCNRNIISDFIYSSSNAF